MVVLLYPYRPLCIDPLPDLQQRMDPDPKPAACFTAAQPLRTHCFDYLCLKFRRISPVWHSLWQILTPPLFYFITFVYLLGQFINTCTTTFKPIDENAFAEVLYPETIFDTVDFHVRECVRREIIFRVWERAEAVMRCPGFTAGTTNGALPGLRLVRLSRIFFMPGARRPEKKSSV